MAATTGETLVVRPNRRRARISMAFTAVSIVAVIALLLRQAFTDDDAQLGWNLTYAVVVVSLFGWQAFVAIRTLRADALAEIGPDGMRINDVGRGWVTLPWPAVGTVKQAGLLRGRVKVWPVPGLTYRTPGAVFPDQASYAKAKQQGFTIDTMTADIRSTELVEAADRYRHGRI